MSNQLSLPTRSVEPTKAAIVRALETGELTDWEVDFLGKQLARLIRWRERAMFSMKELTQLKAILEIQNPPSEQRSG